MRVEAGQRPRCEGRKDASAPRVSAGQKPESRRQGFTYQQIADNMEISVSTAHRYVRDGIVGIPAENAEAVRTLELDRLDLMQQQCFALFIRRARYLGLYQEQAGPVDTFVRDMSHRYAELMAADKPILRPDAPVPANPIVIAQLFARGQE